MVIKQIYVTQDLGEKLAFLPPSKDEVCPCQFLLESLNAFLNRIIRLQTWTVESTVFWKDGVVDAGI